MICPLSVLGNKSRQEERNIETSTTNAKIIIGAAIGGFSFVALILILVLVLLRRHHKLPSNQVPSVSYAVVVCMLCVYFTVKP
mgnify:FL=1